MLTAAKRFDCCEAAPVAGGEWELTGAGPGRAYSVIVRITSARAQRARCASKHSAHSTSLRCRRRDSPEDGRRRTLSHASFASLRLAVLIGALIVGSLAVQLRAVGIRAAHAQPDRASPIRLMPTPRGVLRACEGSQLLRPACPRRLPYVSHLPSEPAYQVFLCRVGRRGCAGLTWDDLELQHAGPGNRRRMGACRCFRWTHHRITGLLLPVARGR